MSTIYHKPTLVFSGIGTQWPGMGSDILESETAYTENARVFDEAFAALSGWSPLEAISDGSDISDASKGHPCVMTVEIGLFHLLRDKGVEPRAIIGHSGGEVAAALAGGALTVGEAALLTWRHVRLLADVAGTGTMLHISLPSEDLQSYLSHEPLVTVAAENSPFATVLAGPEESLKRIMDAVVADTDVFSRMLRVDAPLHSRSVEPFLDELERSLSGLKPQSPSIPIYSSLYGKLAGNDAFDARYWRNHVRKPVAFRYAVAAALSDGSDYFLEISPHAVLQDALIDCSRAAGASVSTGSLMNRDQPAAPVIAETLSQLRIREGAFAAETENPESTDETRRILDADPGRRIPLLADFVTTCLREASEGTIEPSDTLEFAGMGVTSLIAVKLRNALKERLGLDMPATIAFNYPTIPLLADHLLDLLAPESAPTVTKRTPRSTDMREPLAIVGFSCRLPGGADDIEAFWALLRDNVDAVCPVPPDRWDRDMYYDPDAAVPGKSNTYDGGFLTCPIDRFDAHFFNISAREARQLDPQQRLLLEVMWEAFENAGIDITSLQGSQTGVFLGMSSIDYSHAHRDSYRRELIDAYTLTGTTFSAAAGRLAYLHDFRGPCYTVDTACSSSLIALHCACRSLREGESDTAVVCGVNLMLIPDLHVAFTKLGAVSSDGRSKAFDDGADGYGRGEGCVVLVLKRLSDAERDGDPIHALIRGTATNQDGKSNGLTAPNGLSQERVIADALADAGLEPNDINYIEAHGTGTALGDSIEIHSMAKAYCAERSADNPLLIGSVKANIGHLEPAAGVAAIAKILLAMRNRTIPANIHIKTPNRRFDWNRYPIVAPTGNTPWEPGDRIRRAGVSAFGFSGTNVHGIIEEYSRPDAPERKTAEAPAFVLPISARSPESLGMLRELYAERVEGLQGIELADACFTAFAGRAHHGWRIAVSGGNGAEMAEKLRNHALPEAPAVTPVTAMIFTGQGSQYPDIGRELYDRYPVFTKAIDECAEILSNHKIDLMRLLYGGCPADELANTGNAQPVIAAVEYALWRLWMSWGIVPDYVAGHSIGEYPAAVAAGIMSVEDMLTLVAARANAMSKAPPNGMMAAVFAPEETVREKIAGRDGAVIAAVNAPESVSISGTVEAVEAVCGDFTDAGVKSKALRVSHAFHSPLMEEAAREFGEALNGRQFGIPSDAVFVSTVTGKEESEIVTEPDYWVEQILRPVRFADAAALIAGNCPVILEAGGTAALSGLVAQAAPGETTCISSLSPKAGAASTMFEAAARLYAAGVTLDGAKIYEPFGCKKTELPTYPFNRESYWMQVFSEPPSGAAATDHPVLGKRLDSPALNGATVFETVFDDSGPEFLHEHVIYGMPISPGAGHIAMLLAAIREIRGDAECMLRDVEFLSPLVVPEGARRRVQIIFDAPDVTETAFRLASRQEDANEWTTHCTGAISRTVPPKPDTTGYHDSELPDEQPMSTEDFYSTFIEAGYEIGEGFKRITDILSGSDEARCRVSVKLGKSKERGHVAYPGAIDSILQTSLPCFFRTYMNDMLADGATLVPMHIDSVVLWREFPDEVVCRSWAERAAEGLVRIRIVAMDSAGDPVMEMGGLLMQKTNRQTLYRALTSEAGDLLYALEWTESGEYPSGGDGPVIAVSFGDGGLAARIHERRGGLLFGADELTTDPYTLISAVRDGMNTIVFACDEPGGTTENEKPCEDTVKAAVTAGMAMVELTKLVIEKELKAGVCLVTSGADGSGADSLESAGASLWGVAMSLLSEQPMLAGGMLDTDLAESSIALTCGMIGGKSENGGVPFGSVRKGKYHSQRLVRLSSKNEAPPVRTDGTYLITGGSGALGLHTARWLADRGAGCVALASRSGVKDKNKAVLDEIRLTGCRIEEVRCDVSRREDVSRALRSIADTMPLLRGVFHAAGVLDDATIPELTREKFDRVMLPKALGALYIHELTREAGLEWFVMYSSAASLLGSGGQANYSAANTMLNTLAVERTNSGLPALSACWGPWADAGMAAADDRRGARLAAGGILEIDPQTAFPALEKAAASGIPVVGVMAMDWKLYFASRPSFPGDYLTALADKYAPAGDESQTEDSALRRILDGYTPERRDSLEEALSFIAAMTLGAKDASRISPRQPLMEQGFDSLMAVEVRNRLMRETGVDLNASFLFSYPTIEKITDWFAEKALELDSAAAQDTGDLLKDIDGLLE